MATSETEVVCKEELRTKERNLEKYLKDRSQAPAEELPKNIEELAGARQAQEMERQSRGASEQMLKDVRTALSKLKTDSFGICIECHDDIADDRLRAMPWVSRCVPCQNKAGLRVR